LKDTKRKADKLKRDLLRLLNEYARCHDKLARLQQQEERLGDVESVHQLVQKMVRANRGPLDNRCVGAIYRELHSGVRSLVKPLRVAYLGPTYSYSHLAAIERFGTSAELVPVATIAAVFEELNRAHVKFGIVPIENSTDGRVVDTLGMFTRLPVKICGEVQMRIHHYLLGKCERGQIHEVYSKPQALSQCRDWLSKHLPLARTVEMTSTAAAAQLAAEKHGAAAIASLQAAVNYGLNVVAENVEDNKNNITRFAVISDHAGKRTGSDKTAAMFEIAHLPGALADATAIFKRNRLNLTWIESFPMPNTESEYLFFVEMEGHHEDLRVKRALAALAKKTERLEVLGSYARSEPVESP
jgi:chorismate mutase/prephenate dehydratase